jgi:hypothetical protein
MWSIYVITNIPGGLYIGGTRNIERRMREHKRILRTTPEYKVLETGGSDNWRPAEHSWIERYRADASIVLLNKTAGGNGGETLSAETRRKLSIAKKGRSKPPGFGAKISAARKGRPQNWTIEGAARLAQTQFKVGVPHTAEERSRISNDLRKRWSAVSPETRSAMSTALNNAVWAKRSAEERSQIGHKIAASRRRNLGAEWQSENASRAARALFADPQARVRQGERTRNWWANLSPAEKLQQIERRRNTRAANRASAAP